MWLSTWETGSDSPAGRCVTGHGTAVGLSSHSVRHRRDIMRFEDSCPTARSRGVEFRRLPTARRLAIGAERAGRHRAAMTYLLTVDVTSARRLMAMAPETL